MQTLLPRIVQLWEDLQVPLVHRSRFYLAFKGRETFYYEAEHRRLIHQQTQVQPPCPVFRGLHHDVLCRWVGRPSTLRLSVGASYTSKPKYNPPALLLGILIIMDKVQHESVVIYYEAEHRRLVHQQTQVHPPCPVVRGLHHNVLSTSKPRYTHPALFSAS